MKWLFLFISFILVAFGQPAWISIFGMVAAAIGFAIFWRGMLFFPDRRQRFILSLLWFASVQGVQLSWMTTIDYMGVGILVVYLFLIGAMGVQFGLLSLFFKEPIRWVHIFAISGCWVIFEWMRLFFLCGFTWNQVGLALTHSSYSLQFASIWGIFGLSFWVILVNLIALKAFFSKSIHTTAIWLGLAILPYGFGFFQQTWVESTPSTKNLHVALIQTALLPEQKELSSEQPEAYVPALTQWERIFEVFDGEKKVDLIVLPEAALPFGAHRMNYDWTVVKEYFKEEVLPPLKKPYAKLDQGKWKVNNIYMAQAIANHFQAEVILGLDDRDENGKCYNAAFHLKPKKETYERYEKRVLVPLGEYIPMSHLRKFAKFIGKTFGIYGSFERGTKAKVFAASCPIGISICLEETFSHLNRDLRKNGAELFVNLTNDNWFPRSKLPQQHFHHGKVRAAENGVAILRSCNAGMTAGIDCFGRPIAQLPISNEKTKSLYFTLPIRSYRTLYTWWGDGAILGISALGLVAYFFFDKKQLL